MLRRFRVHLIHEAHKRFLKTAGLLSAYVHEGPAEFERRHRDSIAVQSRPPPFAMSAVILAVITPFGPHGLEPCRRRVLECLAGSARAQLISKGAGLVSRRDLP